MRHWSYWIIWFPVRRNALKESYQRQYLRQLGASSGSCRCHGSAGLLFYTSDFSRIYFRGACLDALTVVPLYCTPREYKVK
jgi:hypothetical protein